MNTRLDHFDLTRSLLLGLLGLPLALLNLALCLGNGRFPLAECPFAALLVGGGLHLGVGELLLRGFQGRFEPLAFVFLFFVAEPEGHPDDE